MEDIVQEVMKDKERPAYKYATDIPGLFYREFQALRPALKKSAGLLASHPKHEQLASGSSSEIPPSLNERAQGWLRHLHQKATTADDWSYDSKGPHEWWDGSTAPPMCSWPRFDLQESAYAVALMADKTPAWREVYSTILDGICERYIQHWGTADFINQFGHDPSAAHYPAMFRTFIPPDRFGNYDAPGWTGNGTNKFPDGSPAGYEKDAVGAEGMLFYKGFLVLLFGFHARVSGEDKYLKEFDLAAVGGTTTKWSLAKVAEHLKNQWSQREAGLH
jgi:hypothetical protein